MLMVRNLFDCCKYYFLKIIGHFCSVKCFYPFWLSVVGQGVPINLIKQIVQNHVFREAGHEQILMEVALLWEQIKHHFLLMTMPVWSSINPIRVFIRKG